MITQPGRARADSSVIEMRDPKKRPLKTLERVLSKAGVGSRIEARSWIHARALRRHVVARDRVYLLLYKPTGYLTTYKDPEGRPTVYDLIAYVGTLLEYTHFEITLTEARNRQVRRMVEAARSPPTDDLFGASALRVER